MLTHPNSKPATIADAFRHAPSCQRPDLTTFTGFKGDVLAHCHGCERTVPLRHLQRQISAEVPPKSRYRLDCVRCDRPIPVANAKPRVPLCSRCVTKRKRPKPQPKEAAHAFI